MFKDYYKILGVERRASPEAVKSAYRTLSMKWHPDKNPGRDVTRIMQDLNEAYAILKDPVKRARYDKEYDKFRAHCRREWERSNQDAAGAGAAHAAAGTGDGRSNAEKQERTREYQYQPTDDTVRDDMNEAREYARKLVDEFFRSLKATAKVAAGGAWEETKGYLLGGVILTVIGLIVWICSQ